MTFNDYLSNERIQRATRLLCEEALPITEIAYQSGFQSISNFNRVFNKITHYSPSEYRKNTMEIKSPQVNVGSFNTYTNIFSITFSRILPPKRQSCIPIQHIHRIHYQQVPEASMYN